MMKTEIAEFMNKDNFVYELASKAKYKRTFSTEEKEAAECIDSWAKEIGNKGMDKDHEIAAFVEKTITPEVYEAPDELLDTMFERGSVGEFDDYIVNITPKNELVAYDAAKGGNVPKSYIDFSGLRPTWFNKQVETSISFVDLRRNGFRSIATLTTYAQEALKDAMIAASFSAVDTAITGGDQLINETEVNPTEESADALSLYCIDQVADGETPFAFGLNKYAQKLAKMAGYSTYMSDSMKDDFNRYGLVKFFQGLKIAGISGAKKTAKGNLLVPDKRIFGVAGKIGTLDMKGDVHVYEDMDINAEKVNIKVADFTFGYVISNIEKVAKIVLA